MTTTKPTVIDWQRAHHIADAIIKIAQIDHYLVGLDASVNDLNDLDNAEQVLINRENSDSRNEHFGDANPDNVFAILANVRARLTRTQSTAALVRFVTDDSSID